MHELNFHGNWLPCCQFYHLRSAISSDSSWEPKVLAIGFSRKNFLWYRQLLNKRARCLIPKSITGAETYKVLFKSTFPFFALRASLVLTTKISSEESHISPNIKTIPVNAHIAWFVCMDVSRDHVLLAGKNCMQNIRYVDRCMRKVHFSVVNVLVFGFVQKKQRQFRRRPVSIVVSYARWLF